MKRSFLIGLGLVMLVTSGGFAQEKAANAKDNWVSGEINIFGAGGRFEHMFNANTAIGANIYWNSLIALTEFGIDGTFHFYPTGKMFFAGIGFGFHVHTGIQNERLASGNFYSDWVNTTGVAFTPQVGWKIDVGDPGGFFIQPGAKLPITLGVKRGVLWTLDEEGRFGAGIGFVAYFALGYGF
jgi:hypothetical protein